MNLFTDKKDPVREETPPKHTEQPTDGQAGKKDALEGPSNGYFTVKYIVPSS